MDRLLQDINYGVRLLWKDKAFTATAVVTLAVCIGMNTTIFSIVHSVLLQPLGVSESDRLLFVHNSYPNAGVAEASNAVPDYFDRVRDVKAFSDLALYRSTGRTVGGAGSVERVVSMQVTPSFFRLARVPPMRGRPFTEEESTPGQDNKVVLSHALWVRMFAGREQTIGQVVRINSVPHTIVGIMPPDFTFVESDTELWTPAAFTPQDKSDESRHSNNWQMVGRLAPGASTEQAQSQIDALNRANLDRFPQLKQILVNAGFHTRAVPLQEYLVREIRGTLHLLWGGVLLVLLIGCVNVANLSLVRASARMKELAVRQALGAGVSRIVRQLLTESLLVSLLAGAAGLALGSWALSLLALIGVEDIPRGAEIHMGPVVMGTVLALSIAVGIAIGLLPAFNVIHVNLGLVIRDEGRTGTASRSARFTRRVLVTAQIGFAFVLLIGAGLLLASFRQLLGVTPGFNPDGVLTAMVNLPATRYADEAAIRTFADRAIEKLRTLPGVQHAGITSSLPFGGNYSDSVILAEGHHMKPGESLLSPASSMVTPGYFEAMQIPLVRGRRFTASDTSASMRALVVDTKLAERFWPGQDPLGKRMYLPESADAVLEPPADPKKWLTVVGVGGEVKMQSLIGTTERVGAYYFPFAQSPYPIRTLTFALRTSGTSHDVAPAARQGITSVDPELPLYSVRTMQERMALSLTSRRAAMLLSLIFGGLALFLSAVGIYSVLAYQVAQRRREIGVRIALGSTASAIFRMVLREGLQMVMVGVAAGLVAALALGRAMQSQLYGVSAAEPAVFGLVAVMLALVALAATFVPARRATRIDPAIALSQE